MMLLKRYYESLIHLLYPHCCNGCGSDLLEKDQLICISCKASLPRTSFASFENNPIEKIFYGRLHVRAAHSEFYFMKQEIVQRLLHQLKYKGNQEIGEYLGHLTGESLLKSKRFNDLDLIIPLPLHPKKEFQRGYNQASCISRGIATVMNVPLHEKNVVRKFASQTQTRKSRTERWNNVSEIFHVEEPEVLYGKNILLVDDVITTGASIEACGSKILGVQGTSVSVSSLAYASK